MPFGHLADRDSIPHGAGGGAGPAVDEAVTLHRALTHRPDAFTADFTGALNDLALRLARTWAGGTSAEDAAVIDNDRLECRPIRRPRLAMLLFMQAPARGAAPLVCTGRAGG